MLLSYNFLYFFRKSFPKLEKCAFYVKYLEISILVIMVIHSFFHDPLTTVSNEEHFFMVFLYVRNVPCATCIETSSAGSNLQSYNIVFPVMKGFIVPMVF